MKLNYKTFINTLTYITIISRARKIDSFIRNNYKAFIIEGEKEAHLSKEFISYWMISITLANSIKKQVVIESDNDTKIYIDNKHFLTLIK